MTNSYDILKQICEQRKSVRSFLDKEIPKLDIEKILDIAYTSPYASGRKNWEIITITDRDLIREMAKTVKNKTNNTAQQIDEELRSGFLQYTKNFSFFEDANLLFVLTFRVQSVMAYMMGKNSSLRNLEWERDNFTKSISCVAMLVLLAAECLGYGACYMTGPLIAQDELLSMISAKTGREIGAIIPVGIKNKS